jgi:hypothetical protein
MDVYGGSTAGVAVVPDGPICAYDRCGADSHNPDCKKGIRFGKPGDAWVLGLIPDQEPMSVTSTAEGVDKTTLSTAPRSGRRI